MNKPGRVLLADDEDLFRDTTTDLLRKSGYTVDCTFDAAEAARMLATEQYDVLISDIKMPGNAQLELVLKVNELARGLPIILVTGYPALETAVRAVEQAVVAYLIKPVDMHELLAHVEASVARSRLYRTVTDLQRRMTDWSGDLAKLEEVLRGPLTAGVTEPTRSLLALTFEIVAKAVIDLRRVMEVLAASDNNVQPEEVEGLLGKSEMIENALRETIKALEETKHIFKSKRLKELRQQLQGVLGVLEREKAADAEPDRPAH
jgi:DNA-binding response OmpR family regulator